MIGGLLLLDKFVLDDERPRRHERLAEKGHAAGPQRITRLLPIASLARFRLLLDFVLNVHGLAHRLVDVLLLVVALVEHHSCQSCAYPGGPRLEAGMLLFALTVKFLSINCLDYFRVRMAQLESQYSHLEELLVWCLARADSSRCRCAYL